MSGYSDDVVKQKLLALNDTQDSIVSTAQWLMFHRRQAHRTAEIWLHRVKDTSSNASKKLNLIYLANEIVQQSKARKKEDFLDAFSPLLGEAVAIAYKSTPSALQEKIERVTQVWRQRQVFDQATQEGIEARLAELGKAQSHPHKKHLGGSLASADASHFVPVELQILAHLQHSLNKAQLNIRPTLDPANKSYTNLTSSTAPLPSAPLYAGRLSTLAKDLAAAEKAVSETLKTRKELISSLEKLLETNRAAVLEEEKQLASVQCRHEEVESKKRDVDDAIMRGQSTSEVADLHLGQRPEVEVFTPPIGSPVLEAVTELPEPEEVAQPALPPPAQAPQPEAQSQVNRSFTPPGMPLPPTYQYGRGNNGAYFQGDGTTTPAEQPADDMYGAADAFLETLTPPPAPQAESAYVEGYAQSGGYGVPVSAYSSAPAPVPTNGNAYGNGNAYASPAYLPGIPGLTAPAPEANHTTSNGDTNLNARKRPASALNTGIDPRRRPQSSSSPQKRRKQSEDDFAMGAGGGGLEGLDEEVVGILG